MHSGPLPGLRWHMKLPSHERSRQTPSAGLPFAAEHAEQAESQALSQHKPSIKGATDYWACKVKPGRIMFEIDGVSEVIAREALRLGAMKLPVTTRIVAKEDW